MMTKEGAVNVSKIAKQLGCDRSGLYKMREFKQALRVARAIREEAKQRRPRGTKDRYTGSVEAWKDED
jgi:hypothetical protein